MDFDWNQWLYVLACVLVPAAWGATAAWLFGRIDKRRQKRGEPERQSAYVDYSI